MSLPVPSGPHDAARAYLTSLDDPISGLAATHGAIDFSVPTMPIELPDPLSSLALTIVGQLISRLAARAIFGRLEDHLGGRIDPDRLAASSDESLRGIGLSYAKARALRELAQAVVSSALDFEALAKMSDEAVLARLVALRGIGPWSAQVFMLRQLRRPDVFPAGDIGLRHAMTMLDRLSATPTVQAAEARAEAWRPYRSYAAGYLWRSYADARGAPPNGDHIARPSATVTAAPARNRVTPFGDVEAFPLRGAFTGNRGILHSGREIVRFHQHNSWVTCALDFNGRWNEQWLPHRMTWLFFHDEAVSLAAGHRPCAECRWASYQLYRAAWTAASGGAPPSGREINRQLHSERMVRGTRHRQRHTFPAADLPDGVFVALDDLPFLILGAEAVQWTTDGYRQRRPRPSGEVAVITPPSSVAVIAAGYPVQISEAAR